jgi:hypothetical protein
LYVWAARDTPPPDEALLATTADDAPAARGGLQALAELGHEIVPLSARIPRTYDQRTDVNAILDDDAVQALPGRVEGILAAPSVGTQPAENDDDPSWGRAVLALDHLLRMKMERQLAEGRPVEAWHTAGIGLHFARFLYEKTESLYRLTLAQTSEKAWLEAIAAGLDRGEWSPVERHEIAALPPAGGRAARLLRGVRHEYILFSRAIDQSFASLGWPRHNFTYQRNRTKGAWLRATGDLIAALRVGDLVGAQRALGTTNPLADAVPFRNAVGYRMARASVSGLRAPVDQALAAEARLTHVQRRAVALQ